MFEAFKKIKIKGGCFENETELELFKKMRHFNNKSQQYKTEKTQNIWSPLSDVDSSIQGISFLYDSEAYGFPITHHLIISYLQELGFSSYSLRLHRISVAVA